MPKPVLITVVAFCLMTINLSGQQNGIHLTYHHRVKFEKITPPGTPLSIKQFCITEIDSTVNTGSVIHLDSKVGWIKKCELALHIEDGILIAVHIVTNKESQTKRALEQMEQQFGAPDRESRSDNLKYYWQPLDDEHPDENALLVVDEATGAGRLILEVVDNR